MTMSENNLVEIRENLEECMNSFALTLDISISEAPLSEGGKIAFLEYGISCLKKFRSALAQLESSSRR